MERRPPPALPPLPWVLVGLRGAGKTTLGRALAERTRRAFVDLDEAIQRRTGRTVSEAFEAGTFRSDEREVLRATVELLCLGTPRPAVLATGGGVVEDPENRRILRALPTLYLELSAEDSAARVEGDEANERPPLVPGGHLAEARELLERRAPLYAEVASHTIDGSLPTDELVELALSLLEG